MSLRIALFGQAPLAVDCLDRLLELGHEVAAVYAPPDSGRADPLAARATELGIELFRRRYFQRKTGEPIPAALESYRALGVELNVLASLTSFLPPEITDAPVHKSLCFHPSLLPRFRGGNALQWQIIQGEAESGVSVFVPDDAVDTGPIVVQKGGVSIDPHDTTGTLFFQKLYPLGVDAIIEAVQQIDAGTASARAQDEAQATFQGLVDSAVAGISFGQPADEVDRLARGCDPQPGAFVRLKGSPIRLHDTKLEAGESAIPGRVLAIDDEGICIGLKGGRLRVGRVRAEGGKEPAQAFAHRVGLRVGDDLESA